MPFCWRTCILLKFEIILQTFDFGLKIANNYLILAIYLSLVVFLAKGDAFVKITEHCISLTV